MNIMSMTTTAVTKILLKPPVQRMGTDTDLKADGDANGDRRSNAR